MRARAINSPAFSLFLSSFFFCPFQQVELRSLPLCGRPWWPWTLMMALLTFPVLLLPFSITKSDTTMCGKWYNQYVGEELDSQHSLQATRGQKSEKGKKSEGKGRRDQKRGGKFWPKGLGIARCCRSCVLLAVLLLHRRSIRIGNHPLKPLEHQKKPTQYPARREREQ